MARRGSGGGLGGGGMMAPVLSVATGLLIFVILIIFAPTIAGSIEEAQPELKETCVYGYPPSTVTYAQCDGTGNISAAAGGNASVWNSTDNTDLPTGVDQWTTNIQILGVVVLIISIAIAMYYLKTMA
jgi:hypothetical protein